MNLGNVSVPTEAEADTLETVTDRIRTATMTAAAAAAVVLDLPEHSGQVRMARRLASSHAGKLLHVHDVGWLAWAGTHWSADDPGAPERAVLDVLRRALDESIGDQQLQRDARRCENASGIKGILNIAASLTDFATAVRHLDEDPYLLNTHNGTLNLRTFTLRPHNPADLCTKITGASWDADASGTTWDDFLRQVLPDAGVRQFLQRVAGIGVIGKVIEHVLPILTGTGANGKSTFYKAICYALGDYAAIAEPNLFMHHPSAHPTGQMALLGRRWVVVSETEKGRPLAETTVKRLTGGDPITARHMRQNFVTFNPSHTAVLVTNHLPKVSGDDAAIWRRLKVVPFEVVIPEKARNKRLDEQLQQEADAVLAWAVAGYCDYVKCGGLADPGSVRQATGNYQRSSDVVARFIDEACINHADACATTSTLHNRWREWARVEGVDDMSPRALGQALDRLGYPAKKGAEGSRIRRGICPGEDSA